MDPNAAELKAQLRRKLRAESDHHSAAVRAAASTQICQRLREQTAWREARSILFYFPRPDEPDIHCLFTEARRAGKTAALPRYSPDDGHYVACEVRDIDRDLQTGAFGIHEPNQGCPIFDLKKLDLVLVPGIGFDFSGFRLGRGKGYYDRLLGQIPGYKCGVAFEWQIAFEIPVERHDIVLDCILTPMRWHEVTGRQRS